MNRPEKRENVTLQELRAKMEEAHALADALIAQEAQIAMLGYIERGLWDLVITLTTMQEVQDGDGE